MAGKEEHVHHKGKGIFWAVLVFAVIAAVASSAVLLNSNKQITVNTNSAADVKSIAVSGQSQDFFTPDRADISFTVDTRGQDPSAIQSQNDAVMVKIIGSLKQLGISDANIKTVTYNLQRWTEYDPETDKSVDKGYELFNTVRVTTYDTSMAGKIAGLVVQNGANTVDGISFSLSDESMKKAYGQLLKKAIAEVKQKAQEMASAAGTNIVALSTLSESRNVVPVNYQFESLAPMAKISSVAVNSGTVTVSASVSAVYEISG